MPYQINSSTNLFLLTEGDVLGTDKDGSTSPKAGGSVVVVKHLPALPTGSNNIGSVTNITGTVTLPTGASTSTLQTSGNLSLSNLDSKIPALGQALAAGSVPVVLPSAQLATITPPAAITGFALESGGNLASISTNTARIPVNLTVASTRLLVDGSGVTQPVSLASLPALATGSNAIGSITNTTFAATQSGTWNIGSIASLPALPTGSNVIGSIANTGFSATQAGSWTVTANLGTLNGVATESGNLATIATNTGRLPTDLTVTSNRLLVDGSGVTQPVSLSSLPSLAAGSATIGTVNIGSVALPTIVLNGKTTVTTSGTRVALASSTVAQTGVTIKALRTNTGSIFVGNSTVSSSNGFELRAGETAFLEVSNLNTIFIDSSVSGEGVTYLGT